MTPFMGGAIFWPPMEELLDFRRFRMSNGLRVLVLEDHTLPIVSFQVHFAAGSRHERPGITGISHLFEHMMFRGTKKLGPEEFSKIIQARGGVVNAFTTQDHTTYFENVPREALELVVELEAHRLKELQITAESLATEREVVRSERKMRIANSPFGAVLEELFALAYQRHPYRWPIIGWDHDIKRVTLEECKEYFRLYYAPNNAVVVIAGDVGVEEALSLLQRHYGDIPPQSIPEEVVEPEPPQRGERRAVFKKVAQLEAFFSGFHVPGIVHEDVAALLALTHILSSGRSSRLWRRFVKTGKAAEAGVMLDPPPFWPKDPGLMVVYAVAAPGVDIRELEEEVWREVEEIKSGRFEEGEVEKARKGLRAAFIRRLQTLFFRGLLGGIYEIKTGGFEGAWKFASSLEEVTPEGIQEVARRYLHEDNRTVVTLKPVSPEENERLGLIQ